MNDIELKQFMAEHKEKQAAKADPAPKSLRDEFAMAALPAFFDDIHEGEAYGDDAAMYAYLVADAMMAAREVVDD